MKLYSSILFTLSIFVFFSCDNSEKEGVYNIYGKWNVTELMSVESVSYSKKEGFNPVIEFKNDGTYILKLDMNSCIGSFILKSSDGISILAPGCTKICCDSEFSKKLVQMLSQVRTYTVEQNELKFNVPEWGWIKLELYN